MTMMDGMDAMYSFRLAGEIFQVSAIIILLVKIIWTKTCAGISGKSQILFTFVSTTRYLDVFVNNNCLFGHYTGILSMISSYIIVILIFFVFRKTYQHKRDIFMTELLISPCFMQALWLNYEFTALKICWKFSIYLEGVAILPQFYMIYKKKQMDKSMFLYLLAMGLYKGFYIFHWVYRYLTEYELNPIVNGEGSLYILLYTMGAGEILFYGVKFGKGSQIKLFLKRKIFFISKNEPLSEPLTSNYERLVIEKNSTQTNQKLKRCRIISD